MRQTILKYGITGHLPTRILMCLPCMTDSGWMIRILKISIFSEIREVQLQDGLKMLHLCRLKTITLAYNFEQNLLKKIGFAKARLYFSGTNLVTLTKYTGYDPEIAQFPGNDATIGVDLSVYPTARMYTFGAEFTF